MTAQVPESLITAKNVQLLVDAVYYVVRVLRNSRRGFQTTAVSTEPSPQAHRLAALAIEEIEAAEGRSLLNLNDRRIGEYITALESFLIARSMDKDDQGIGEAELMLKKMRGESPS